MYSVGKKRGSEGERGGREGGREGGEKDGGKTKRSKCEYCIAEKNSQFGVVAFVAAQVSNLRKFSLRIFRQISQRNLSQIDTKRNS